MTRSLAGVTPRRLAHATVVVTTIGAIACATDRSTSPLQPDDSPAFAKVKAKISISKVTLASSTIAINNPGTTYSITIKNSTGASASTIFIQAEMQQGTTTRASGGTNVFCGAGSGVLPPGSCTMGTRPAFADDYVGGSGTFVPGAATLLITLNQFDGSTSTELDATSLPVTLVAGPTTPYISNLSLDFTSLVINGDPGSYTVSIWNPGATESTDLVQGYMNQGTTSQAGGGTNVTCGSNASGVLPHGNCTFQYTTFASNSVGGSGTLVAGAATFRLELLHLDAGTNTTSLLDAREVGITLTNP